MLNANGCPPEESAIRFFSARKSSFQAGSCSDSRSLSFLIPYMKSLYKLTPNARVNAAPRMKQFIKSRYSMAKGLLSLVRAEGAARFRFPLKPILFRGKICPPDNE
jgi:hypothetical protein